MQHSKFNVSLMHLNLLLLFMWFSTNFYINCKAQFVESQTDYKHQNQHYNQAMDYNYRYHISHDASAVHVQHNEQRQGDQVMGQYSLLEPDGQTIREVYYHVDGNRGFRSIIRLRSLNSRVHQLFQLSRNQPALPIAHAQPVAFVV